MGIKEIAKKTWKFIWKDDSIWSWLVSLALAFIIVKFVFFPLLSLTLATSLPLVVVESESMHHPGSFVGNTIGLQDSFETWWNQEGSWYESFGIDKAQAENWKLRTGLEKGDIVLVTGHSEPEVGDVVIFNAGQTYPIIHRVISIEETPNGKVYQTKGDNNQVQLYFERDVSENVVIGKALFRIPKLGWLKLAFVELIKAFR